MSTEFNGSLYKNPSNDMTQRDYLRIRQSCDTENAMTPNGLGEGELSTTLARNVNMNLQEIMRQESQRLLNLKIETGTGPDDIPP